MLFDDESEMGFEVADTNPSHIFSQAFTDQTMSKVILNSLRNGFQTLLEENLKLSSRSSPPEEFSYFKDHPSIQMEHQSMKSELKQIHQENAFLRLLSRM